MSFDPRPLDRRTFLKRAAQLSAAGLIMLSPNAWAARALESSGSRKRLVVVFLRGAVDGLNVVVPHGDSTYYDVRPTIAIERPGTDSGVLDLDGHFGLHPSLAALMPMWRDGTLAFVHACGSPDPSRSHFDAQDFMESGTPGIKATADGWMNRVLAGLGGDHPPTEAIVLGPTVPRSLAGRMPVANVPNGRAADRPMAVDFPKVESAFDRLYSGRDPLSLAYREGRDAHQKMLAELETDMTMAAGGAPTPQGYANDADNIARLITRDPTVKLGFMALSGWDTHVNEGPRTGQLAVHLRDLGNGLASFVKSLGAAYSETVIIVMSEFGRTVRENGNAGTDHGHGNAMWVMGGAVRGRKVYAKWPGLADADLYQGRDVPVTTDYREVVSVVLKSHLGLDDSRCDRVFPGRPGPTGNVSGLIRG